MRRARNPWVLVVFLLTGALVGGFAGELLSQYSFFEWMNFGSSSGSIKLFSLSLNPLIDTHILRFGLDLAMRINAGSIIGIVFAILLYTRR